MKMNEKRKPEGFTLVEMLVVILILLVLTALLLPAVHKAQLVGEKTNARADLTHLSLAYGSFEQTLGVKPMLHGGGPGGTFRLRTSYLDSATRQPFTDSGGKPWPEIRFLLAAWPSMNLSDNGLRINGAAGGVDLDANQALLFWLTGSEPCEFEGFSRRARTPFSPPLDGEDRLKFSQAPVRKLTKDSAELVSSWIDPWGNRYAVVGCDPFTRKFSGRESWKTFLPSPYRTAYRGYLNEGGLQVVSAGPDGKFAPFTDGQEWTPGFGPWASGDSDNPLLGGDDDLSNFHAWQLGTP